MKLVVIRHGQTDYNAQRRFQGQANIPLNDVGRAQARRAGLLLGQVLEAREESAPPLTITSSDLLRTQETTQIICNALSAVHPTMFTKVELEPRLREFHCGLFENSTYEEFVQANPDVASNYMKFFDEDPYATRFPGTGGESRLDVMNRVGAALTDVQNRTAAHPAIWVVHGGVIDVLLELTHIQNGQAKANRISAGNGDVLILSHAERGEKISRQSLQLGHSQTWQLERHYKVGDTIAAKVVK